VASPLTTLVRGLGSLLSGIAIALEQVRVMRETASPAHETEGGGGAADDSREAEGPAPEQPAAEEGGGEENGGEQQEESEPEKEAE
jgi:hypothetical protein